jgi:hypothetical protein
MKALRSASLASVLALGLLMLCEKPAHAYLDAGNGSMLVQLLLGGVAGIVVALKLAWHRIADMFRRKNPPSKEPSEPRRAA